MESFLDLVKERRSIRAYSSQPVPEEVVRSIIELALLAPSARNLQPWHVIVVTDERRRKQLADIAGGQSFVGEAPVVLVFAATEPGRVMSCGIPAYAVDLSILVTHVILAAAEKGLGTCWIGAFDPDRAARAMEIPEEHRVFTILPLGYPAETPAPRSRESFEEMVSFEGYGGAGSEDI